MFVNSATGLLKGSVPLLAVLLAVGCAQNGADAPASSSAAGTPTSAAAATSASTAPTAAQPPAAQPEPSAAAPTAGAPSAATPAPVAAPPAAAEPGVTPPCSDGALSVTGGQVEQIDTQRRSVVTFTNTSSAVCAMVGYPVADLLGGGGGVLVHVEKRPANAAPRLTLQPGEFATADVQASSVDSTTGDPCGRLGTLSITPPDGTQSRVLEVYLPVCDATVSSVG